METPIQIRQQQFRSIEDLRMGVDAAALHTTQLGSRSPGGKVMCSLINDMFFSSGLVNADIGTRGRVANNQRTIHQGKRSILLFTKNNTHVDQQ